MKNKILMMMAAVTVLLTMNSCRETADYVASYGQNDFVDFSKADDNYEEQFKNLWTALNCNYGIWDYEAENGVDWDAVYDEYLPKMQELDERDRTTNPVTAAELKKLYEEILGRLHDGHLDIQVKNLHTGEFISVNPAYLRNATRPDINVIMIPNKDFYKTAAAGENQMSEFFEGSSRASIYIGKQIKAAVDSMQILMNELKAINPRTDYQDSLLSHYNKAVHELTTFHIATFNDISYYNNTLTQKYAYLGFPLNNYDVPQSSMMDFSYVAFPDGIAYFGFSQFGLSSFLSGRLSGTPCTDEVGQEVEQAWQLWFNKVQTLHKDGKLKGVIIDVRCNNGGDNADYAYLLGALLPAGGQVIGYNRFKNGIGRYDFSPKTKLYVQTMNEDHETITEPVVVLCNANSVSMAEITCLGAKEMENGCLIGTRTWGGMCMLMADPIFYSVNYASTVGVKDVTPFYVYIPTSATITKSGILEGVGVTPDIEAALDETLLAVGRDSQLERALQYIRTGK